MVCRPSAARIASRLHSRRVHGGRRFEGGHSAQGQGALRARGRRGEQSPMSLHNAPSAPSPHLISNLRGGQMCAHSPPSLSPPSIHLHLSLSMVPSRSTRSDVFPTNAGSAYSGAPEAQMDGRATSLPRLHSAGAKLRDGKHSTPCPSEYPTPNRHQLPVRGLRRQEPPSPQVVLAHEALFKLVPSMFIDTMGCAFTYPVARCVPFDVPTVKTCTHNHPRPHPVAYAMGCALTYPFASCAYLVKTWL